MSAPAALRSVRRAAVALLDTVLPPQCMACRAPVERLGSLCATCWNEVDFITDPVCALCGTPFEYDAGEGALCAACIAKPPVYGRARAALRYGDRSRGLVLGFKHGDRTERAATFAGWMARAGAAQIAGADVIAPVPLHRLRLAARRYNQSAMLANALGRSSGIPVIPDLLVRTRPTPSQAGRNRRARAENVRGAFAIRPNLGARIKGRRVLIIDDVLTSGATVAACARTLLRGGAASVDALTLARVVRPVPGSA
jgi:ComF family protein